MRLKVVVTYVGEIEVSRSDYAPEDRTDDGILKTETENLKDDSSFFEEDADKSVNVEFV